MCSPLFLDAEILGDPYSKKPPLPSIGTYPRLSASPKNTGRNTFGTFLFLGGNGTENTVRHVSYDNCEQFSTALYLSSIFSFSHKKEKGSETHLCFILIPMLDVFTGADICWPDQMIYIYLCRYFIVMKCVVSSSVKRSLEVELSS